VSTSEAVGTTPAAPTIRVGVVGLGAVARAVYLPLLVRRPDLFRVTALCDLSRTLLDDYGERLAVPARGRHTDLAELLEAGEADAVIVLTSGSHAEAAQLCAAAGLPTLVEKPLGYTLAEVDALRGCDLVQVGYMKLFDPAVRRAVELLADRPRPRAVDVTVLHPPMADQRAPQPASPAVPAPPPDVAGRLGAALYAQREQALGPAAQALGSLYTDVLLGSIVHDLYVVRALVGDPKRIDWAVAWPDPAAPTSVELAGTLPADARLSLRWHYLERYPAYREEVRVHDEEGSVELTFPSPYLLHAHTELRVTDRDGAAERSATFRSTREAFDEQLTAFHRHATDGGSPVVTVEGARRDIVTCQRIARALARQHGLPIGGEAEHAG
jgi:predicted dehydrogenase